MLREVYRSCTAVSHNWSVPKSLVTPASPTTTSWAFIFTFFSSNLFWCKYANLKFSVILHFLFYDKNPLPYFFRSITSNRLKFPSYSLMI